MLTPYSETQAADIIRDHATRKTPLKIIGGNTRSGFGNAVAANDALSSRAMNGIVSYVPAEMVMTAKAGTPLATIEAALAENRQMMAFEPMDHRPIMGTMGEPTIGGVFAANVSGPRRYVAGAARDSLLGVRFVNGGGEIIRAGGRVMKNVTGLDLSKLLAGSHGTLGFLTEVTFRVLPKPPSEKTVVVSGLDDEAATRIMAAAMAMSVEVSGAAHLPESVRSRFIDGVLPEGPATILRLEGLGKAVFCGGRCGMLLPMPGKTPSRSGKSRSRRRKATGWSRRCAWKRASTPFTTGRAALSGCRWKPIPRRICCAARSGRWAAATQRW